MKPNSIYRLHAGLWFSSAFMSSNDIRNSLSPCSNAPSSRPKFDSELLRGYIKKLLSTTLQNASWPTLKDRDRTRAWCKEIGERVKERMIGEYNFSVIFNGFLFSLFYRNPTTRFVSAASVIRCEDEFLYPFLKQIHCSYQNRWKCWSRWTVSLQPIIIHF